MRAADMDFPMRRFRSPNSSSNRPQKKKERFIWLFASDLEGENGKQTGVFSMRSPKRVFCDASE